MIKYFYDKLHSLNDLSPSTLVNNTFSELCNYVINNDFDVKVSNKVDFINNTCANAEYELEKYYSKLISGSNNPLDELYSFPYYDNYLKLIKLEYLNMSYFKDNIDNILFIGGGPLPLSSIILAKNYGIKSTIVDIDDEAVELSKQLVSSLGLEELVIIKKGDAISYTDNNQYDICYIASLVFLSQNIDQILNNINNINFGFVLSRTSDRSRKLLYRSIDIDLYKKYFDIKLIVNPKNEIVNSFILSTKK